MVGIDVPGTGPAGRLDGLLGGRALVGGLGAGQEMLAVTLVPYDRDIDTLLSRLPDRCDLRGALAPEAVAGAYGIPFNRLHGHPSCSYGLASCNRITMP
jgi:hypothetical protein